MVFIKNLISKIIFYLMFPYNWIKDEIAFRKKMKELREKDPFIYD